MKKVTRCSVYYQAPSAADSNYAIDMGELGDALIVQGNAVHGDLSGSSKNTGTNALRISHCFGGIISGNILNGNVLINKCKGVKFTGNHLEYGPQVRVISSTVAIENNFFHKGLYPNVVIESGKDRTLCIVDLSENIYAYLSNSDRCYIDKDDVPGLSVYRKLRSIGKISDYDIEILKQAEVDVSAAIINIRNEYRYFAIGNNISMNRMGGIKIVQNKITSTGTDNYVSLDEFNNRSWYLSKNSTLNIARVPKVAYPSFSIDIPYHPFLELSSMNNGIPGEGTWFKGPGTVSYQYQAIWSTSKNIVGEQRTVSKDNKTSFNISNGPVLFSLYDVADGCANSLMLRIWRLFKPQNIGPAAEPDEFSTVDVPITGCRTLIDNGVTMSGYKWNQSTFPLSPDTVVLGSTLTYVGDLVIENTTIKK